MTIRSRPSKPNQRKGQNEKFMNFAFFCEFWCFFSRETSTTHIEFLFRNAPAKSFMNWPFFGLVCRGHYCNQRVFPRNCFNKTPSFASKKGPVLKPFELDLVSCSTPDFLEIPVRDGQTSEPPDLGSAEGGHPDFFRFLPISAPYFGVPRFVPICSDLLRSLRF